MKLDCEFIKNILTIIEKYKKYMIMRNELFEKLNMPNEPTIMKSIYHMIN